MSEGLSSNSEGERLAVFAYENAEVAARVEALALQHVAQLLLQRKVLALEDVADALARAARCGGAPDGPVGGRVNAASAAAVLARVGAALRRAADLDVCVAYDEARGAQVWVLRNAAADALALAGAACSPAQLAGLRAFLDWALADDRRAPGAAAAMTRAQLAAAHPALTGPVVARLCRAGWLAEVPGERPGAPRIAVGARLLAELAPYIAATVGSDARACVICDHPVLLVCFLSILPHFQCRSSRLISLFFCV